MADESKRGNLRVITVTVSDKRKRVQDEAGKAVDDELRNAGFKVVRHTILKDEPEFIRAFVANVANGNESEAVVLTGGTGINPRDQTFEALEGIFEKRIDGFGEAFRRLSFDEIGPMAILSRATAGVINRCIVYSLPGSTRGATLGVKRLVIPTLEHAVDLAIGRETHTTGFPPPMSQGPFRSNS
jgi:molybdenum cofactor biosynthesis protein B